MEYTFKLTLTSTSSLVSYKVLKSVIQAQYWVQPKKDNSDIEVLFFSFEKNTRFFSLFFLIFKSNPDIPEKNEEMFSASTYL